MKCIVVLIFGIHTEVVDPILGSYQGKKSNVLTHEVVQLRIQIDGARLKLKLIPVSAFKLTKMSFPAEQLAALIRQSQQIAEMRMKEKIPERSESPNSNPASEPVS